MPYNSDDLKAVQSRLQEKQWLVACLCAAWCDTCGAYRTSFDGLIAEHGDKCFAWIDIEDHAALVDELEIENFPTILIEFKGQVLFFGTMLPDASQLNRLLQALQNTVSPNNIGNISVKSFEGLPAGWSLQRQLS